jgi:hypothetical protein
MLNIEATPEAETRHKKHSYGVTTLSGIWLEHQRVHRLIPFTMVFSRLALKLQGV